MSCIFVVSELVVGSGDQQDYFQEKFGFFTCLLVECTINLWRSMAINIILQEPIPKQQIMSFLTKISEWVDGSGDQQDSFGDKFGFFRKILAILPVFWWNAL